MYGLGFVWNHRPYWGLNKWNVRQKLWFLTVFCHDMHKGRYMLLKIAGCGKHCHPARYLMMMMLCFHLYHFLPHVWIILIIPSTMVFQCYVIIWNAVVINLPFSSVKIMMMMKSTHLLPPQPSLVHKKMNDKMSTNRRHVFSWMGWCPSRCL